MSEYQSYRDLALLCIVFGLTDRGNKLTNIDKVRERMEEIFPEEKNFLNLLQRSESDGSILVKNNSITVTKIGIKSAQRLCESIRGIIKMRAKKFRCLSNICHGKEIILFTEIINGKCPHCGLKDDLREVK